MKTTLRILYGTTVGGVLLLVFFFERMDFVYKRGFALHNATLLLIDAIVLALCAGGARLLLPAAKKAACRRGVFLSVRILFASLLFAGQLALCANNLFEPGWDVAAITDSARALANGGILQSDYYSLYPNNLMSVYVYGLISLMLKWFGPWETVAFPVDMMAFCILNCLLSSAAGLALRRCVKRMAHSDAAADCAWLLYAMLVGMSPWLLVPYSDSLSLIFPILLLDISLRGFRRGWARWALLGGVGAMAYLVKPHAAVMLIAVLLSRLMTDVLPQLRRPSRRDLRRWLSAAAILCVCFAGGLLAAEGLEPAFGFEINREESLGAAHFFMMGLNEETNGSYYRWDVSYSVSFPTRWERAKAGVDLGLHRILWMGPAGFARHAAKKALVNFHDGTFAWKMDGGEYFARDGGSVFPESHEALWSTAVQAVWVGVLAACLLLAFARADSASVALWLCLLGVTAMVMLFESRARYLYGNAPVFIAAAVLGANRFAARFRRAAQDAPPAPSAAAAPKKSAEHSA